MARLAYGFELARQGKPRPGNYCLFGTDTAADVKAAWEAYHGRSTGTPMTATVLRVWKDWHRIKGSNPPLKKNFTGATDFDYNIDGLAHYGMLPDFLQDARNVGLTPSDLAPLFRGAQDYVAMWQTIEARKSAVGRAIDASRGVPRPTSSAGKRLPSGTRVRRNPLQGVPTDLRKLHAQVGRYFTFAVGFDHAGGDYRSLRVGRQSFVPCAQACQRETRCRAFTWLGGDGRCYLKGRVNRKVRRAGYVTGAKRALGRSTTRRVVPQKRTRVPLRHTQSSRLPRRTPRRR